MKIPKAFLNKNSADIAVVTLVYSLCIVSATFIRWINYFNLLATGVMLLYICLRKRITKSPLNLLWAGYILVYPLLDAAIRGEAGLSSYTTFCYVTPMVFLLLTDINIGNFGEFFISFSKIFAWFQAFGIFLEIVSERAFTIIAYRLLGMWTANVVGFSTHQTVAAYLVCFGISAYFSEYLVLERKNTKEAYGKLLSFAVLFCALIITGKRSFLLISGVFFVILLLIFYTTSKRKFVATLFGGVLVGIVGAGASLIFYFAGSENSLARVGETIIGLINGQDVSNMRSTWAEYMAEWSQGHEWFGIGWESFQNRIMFTPYGGRVPNGHNVYLQIMCEEGYIGLIVFSALVIATVIYAAYNYAVLVKTGNKSAIKVAIFSLYTVGLFAIYSSLGNAIYDAFVYLYFFAGIQMTVATGKARRRTEQAMAKNNKHMEKRV